MKQFAKKIINGGLKPLNLEMVYAANDEVVGKHLFSDLPAIIANPAPVCIDAGANEGQTIEALQSKFSAPIVYAFEPSSETFQKLKAKNFGPNIHLHQMALGQTKEQRAFRNYSNSTLSSFFKLEADPENQLTTTALNNTEIVKIETLDSFLAHHQIQQVDLLKVDTQGFDLDVLLGAQQALRSGVVKHVLVELNYVNFYEGQCSPDDIVRLMRDNELYPIDMYEKIRRGKTIAWCTALFGRR